MGRVILVTGGTRGIGRRIAARFAEAGDSVVVCGRTEPGGDVPGEFRTLDVRDPDAVEAVVASVVADHGRLDVVVNNAGGSPPVEALSTSPRLSRKIVDLNMLAPLWVARAAHPALSAAPDGNVVNISSLSGVRPSPGTAVYGAAKAGLLGLSRSLAAEWAPAVRVNALVVGLVVTEASYDHYRDPQTIARIAATVPMGRLGEPADVAGACWWIASPDAGWVTGAELQVHGGGELPPFLAALEG